jgi:hypothetical protein
MTSFDDRLRDRLRRLDDAVPLSTSHPLARHQHANSLPRAHQRRLPRRLVFLVAAAAILIMASTVAAQRVLFPERPHPMLERALSQVFQGPECLSAADARRALQAELAALRYDDWTIESRSGAEAADCVTAGILSTQQAIALFPAVRQEVAEAVNAVADEMLLRCFNREDATLLVSSVLISLGLTDFEVRADPWGPHIAPVGQEVAYQRHVDAGCFVYAGLHHDADGRPLVDLWGPWP